MTDWSGYRSAPNGVGTTQGSEVAPLRPRRRRWPIVLAVLAAAVVIVLVVVLLIVWWKRDGDGSTTRANWQPAQQAVLSPMSAQPVPGWITSVTDLGLPDAAPGAADRSRIAISDNPSDASAFVGYLGDHAYFVASSSSTPAPHWWLVGVDVRDGRRLFAPAPLDIATIAPDCFLNGPTMIFCLRDDGDLRNNVAGGIAWVIDAKSGDMSYTGPTDLRTYPGKLNVQQVGMYVVAEAMNQGVYGVGPDAETTWFVPGDGKASGAGFTSPSIPPQSLATQTTSGRGSDGKVVFSLADGTVITPELGAGAQQQSTVIYPGGFAAEVAVGDDLPNVEFFDANGKRTSTQSIRGSLWAGADLPIVQLPSDEWAVFTPHGDKLLEIPGEGPRQTQLVGTRLFVDESGDSRFPRWQQYDLKTGGNGKTCEFDMGYRYLGTDGSIGVFRVDNPEVGLVAKGRNLSTCDTVWELPSQLGSLARVWRVNTTLVQLSDDGTELMSLVAPS